MFRYSERESAIKRCYCDAVVADARQVLVTASATRNGNHDDPLSQHSVPMLNGDHALGNKCESFGNDAFVNGRTDHDTRTCNNASHLQVTGSTANSQSYSVQR